MQPATLPMMLLRQRRQPWTCFSTSCKLYQNYEEETSEARRDSLEQLVTLPPTRGNAIIALNRTNAIFTFCPSDTSPTPLPRLRLARTLYIHGCLSPRSHSLVITVNRKSGYLSYLCPLEIFVMWSNCHVYRFTIGDHLDASYANAALLCTAAYHSFPSLLVCDIILNIGLLLQSRWQSNASFMLIFVIHRCCHLYGLVLYSRYLMCESC